MPVTGIGPVADGNVYGKWLDDTAGTSGIGPFASGDTYAQAIGGGSPTFNLGDLSNLTRFAGGLGQLFGDGGASSIEDYIKEATRTLKQGQRQTTKKINQRIENIYPGLTGSTAADKMPEYLRNFAETAQQTREQGRADLGISPDISTEYNRFNTRVQDIQNQYSLAGRLGGYEKLALDPPVVSMDVGSIRDVADWVDPTSNQIKGKYKAMYDYQDPQTQQFIYGSRNTADAIGRYYNTSGDVAGLMNYGGLG